MGNFEVAKQLGRRHLVVHPRDAALNPPQSYLYVQDGLIIACGVVYTICYLAYMKRTYRDKKLAGPVELLWGNISYELFYAFVIPTTRFEFFCFLVWFLFDFAFLSVAIIAACKPTQRARAISMNVVGAVLGVCFLKYLTQTYPDDLHQVTAYWTGILLQLPIGWSSLLSLLKDGPGGHSLEAWLTRTVGCVLAYSVFIWRYINVPQNWSYVSSPWSVAIMVLTLLPELIYPFIYIPKRISKSTKTKEE